MSAPHSVHGLFMADGHSVRSKGPKREDRRWGYLRGADPGSKRTRVIC